MRNQVVSKSLTRPDTARARRNSGAWAATIRTRAMCAWFQSHKLSVLKCSYWPSPERVTRADRSSAVPVPLPASHTIAL